MAELPDFVSHLPAFDPQLAPPYQFRDVAARIFLVEAEKEKLTAMCDKYINDVAESGGSGFRVEPIASLVLIDLLTYKRMYSIFDGAEKSGYSSQNELFFAIPVALYVDDAKAESSIPVSVGLFTPYMFVDNDWSQIAGREIVGFPKLNARFELPADPLKLDSSKVDARVLDPLAGDTKSTYKTILQIQAAKDAALMQGDARGIWPFGPVNETYNVAERGAPFPTSAEILALLLKEAGVGLNNFSLRQYRDALRPRKASFQSVLHSRMTLDDFINAGLFETPLLKVNDFGSFAPNEKLGLKKNSAGYIIPKYSFLYQADFGFAIEQALLTRCGDTITSTPPRVDCADLIGAGVVETRDLVKKQARVAKRMIKRMSKGKLNPEPYLKDMENGCSNVVSYCGTMCKLTKRGLKHIYSG